MSEYEKLVEKARKIISDGGPIYGDPDADARSILALVAETLGEPTREMVEAALQSDPLRPVTGCWSAMLATSPLHPPGDSSQPKDDV